MGVINSKFFKKDRRLMLDKANYTSNYSLNSSVTSDNSHEFITGMISTVEETRNYETTVPNPRLNTTLSDIDRLPSEVQVNAQTSITDETTEKNLMSTGLEKKIKNIYWKHEVEKLGINEINSGKPRPFYSGIIYLPECDLVLSHYLALYRLKLDTLSQHDFESWCSKVGHLETSKAYSHLVTVYAAMKQKHFKDSYIINRIMSRQNVHLKISDLFGDENNRLRAMVVIGDRRTIVQNVIDCYCFAIKGHIAFVIKSADEYKKYAKSSANMINQMRSDNSDLVNSYSRGNYRLVKSRITVASKKRACRTSSTYSNFIEVLNIHPNSTNDLTMHSNVPTSKNLTQIEQTSGQMSNYMRFQRNQDDVDDVCYNNPIFSNGDAYNLVSIIADKTYAYILCRKNDLNGNNRVNTDLSMLKNEDMIDIDPGINQSNSFRRINTLKKILRNEIFDCCNKRNYGVKLSRIPCGELFVVRCCVDNLEDDRELLFNNILYQNLICGKVINKEYNLDSQLEKKIIMHLHGNEKHVINCCKVLRTHGLANNFQLVRPYSSDNKMKQVRSLIS